MRNDRYFADGHLTEQAWSRLAGTPDGSDPSCTGGGTALSDEDPILLLSHLESCRECMSRFLDTLEEDRLLTPPEGLEVRIAVAVSEEYAKQTTGKRARRARVLQITKLAVAVCLTMVLFYGGGLALWKSRDAALVQPPGSTVQEPADTGSRPVDGKHTGSGSFLTDLGRSISDGFFKFADSLNHGFQFEGDGRS